MAPQALPIDFYNAKYDADTSRPRFTTTLTAAMVNDAIDADQATARSLGLASMSAKTRALTSHAGSNPEDLLSEADSLFTRKPTLATNMGIDPQYANLISQSRVISSSLGVVYNALASQCRTIRYNCILELQAIRDDLETGCQSVIANPNSPPDSVHYAQSALTSLRITAAAPLIAQVQATKATKARHETQAQTPAVAAVPGQIQNINNQIPTLAASSSATPTSTKKPKKKATKKSKTTTPSTTA